jgi:PST family polysaccharide transporter
VFHFISKNNYLFNKLSKIFKSNELSPTYKKVLGNTGWLIFDRVLRMIVGIYVTVWVARYLGPVQFGLLNYAFALTTILSLLSTLGLEQIIIRDLAKDSSQKNEILGTSFILKITGAFASISLSILVVSILRSGEYLTIFIVGIIAAGILFQSTDIIDLFFKSQVEAKYPVFSKSIGFILLNIIKIVLILNNAPLIAFAWAALAEIVLGAIGLLLAYRITGNNIREWKFSLNKAKELLNESWPLLLSGIAILIYMRIDQVMLGQMSGDKSVGFYSAALKLSEVWYTIPIAIMNSATPIITKSYVNNIDQYNSRLQKLFNLMTLIGLSLAIPTTFLSPLIIKIIYGNEYIASASILSIHIWTSILVGWGVLKDMILVTQHLTKIILIASVIGAVSNILINFILIPKYLGNGAAIATLCSQILSVSLVLFFFRDTRKFVLMQLKSIPKFYDIIPK